MKKQEEVPQKRFILHVEVEGFYGDDLDEMAGCISQPDPPTAEDRLCIVTEEWMRPDVGLTLISLPGEKCMSDDFEVFAYVGRIVGAEIMEPLTRD